MRIIMLVSLVLCSCTAPVQVTPGPHGYSLNMGGSVGMNAALLSFNGSTGEFIMTDVETAQSWARTMTTITAMTGIIAGFLAWRTSSDNNTLSEVVGSIAQ